MKKKTAEKKEKEIKKEKAKIIKKTKPKVVRPKVKPAAAKPKPVKAAKPKAAVRPKPVVKQKAAPKIEAPTPAIKAEPEVKKPQVVERKPAAPVPQAPPAPPKEAVLKTVEVQTPITVKDLAGKLSVKPNDLIKSLMNKKVFATINQSLDEAVAREISKEFGYEIKRPPTMEEELLKEHHEKALDKSKLVLRAPVVTFMGHVDHGKTSLLDYIRKSNVAEKEHGGITQHIGAYEVKFEKGRVTFLDTPGHEAFTAMRARGAKATDVVVLVIAADDGVMPQTIEALNHAKAAGVPIVVALNKCDLPSANIDKVKKQLTQYDLSPEDWGGKTIVVPVSAKTGQGVNELLEMLLLEAELLELKANPGLKARGVVIEGHISQGKGPIASVLVKNGTLHTGDVVLTGLYYGRVRAMLDDKGKRVDAAPPSKPVEIMGLSGVPQAGDEFFVVKDEKKAKTLSLLKQDQKRSARFAGQKRVTLEDIYTQAKEGKIKELKIILKGDVQGSIEALGKSLENLSTDQIKLSIIHSATGNINESDVILAAASNAVIIGFNVKAEDAASQAAEKEKVEIKIYHIIYEAIADVRAAMEGMLEPISKEVFLGRAVIKQVFKLSSHGVIAGCQVVKGTINRQAKIKLVRDKQVVYEGKVGSLKRFKDDVREVAEGFECGIGIAGHNDIKEGDIIEAYTIEMVARRL
ncbi:MAG: translation initiation factor IF-2 [Candidatus Omnitrophica bacterium]|nr:translation initiation factor IF-2 [Candidatus Omnitrophota bacterium]